MESFPLKPVNWTQKAKVSNRMSIIQECHNIVFQILLLAVPALGAIVQTGLEFYLLFLGPYCLISTREADMNALIRSREWQLLHTFNSKYFSADDRDAPAI